MLSHKVQALFYLLVFFMPIPTIVFLAFTFFVSFQAWPQTVLTISFLAGILVCVVLVRLARAMSNHSHGVRGWNPLGRRDDDSKKPTTDTANNEVIGDEEKENKKRASSKYTRKYMTVMLSYISIARTSTIRFFERQLPHDTIIPDRDKRQTGPKMSTIAPPYIPW